MAGANENGASTDTASNLATQVNDLSVTSEGEQPNLAERSLLQKVIRKGLVENKNDLEIQRKDPKSPLFSVKSFEALNLKPALLKGVYGMGFNAPSKIQETALPTLLADPPQNMIAQSQSGTGKTAAFVLAMLSRVDTSKPYPQVSIFFLVCFIVIFVGILVSTQNIVLWLLEISHKTNYTTRDPKFIN